MAALSGVKLLLYTPSDATIASQAEIPTGANDFALFGGFQSKDFSLEASEIDITTDISNENKEILDERGIKSFPISGSGVYQDTALYKAIETNALNQKLRWFRLIQDDDSDRSYTAKFKIVTISKSASYDGALNFTITLSSSGALTIA